MPNEIILLEEATTKVEYFDLMKNTLDTWNHFDLIQYEAGWLVYQVKDSVRYPGGASWQFGFNTTVNKVYFAYAGGFTGSNFIEPYTEQPWDQNTTFNMTMISDGTRIMFYTRGATYSNFVYMGYPTSFHGNDINGQCMIYDGGFQDIPKEYAPRISVLCHSSANKGVRLAPGSLTVKRSLAILLAKHKNGDTFFNPGLPTHPSGRIAELEAIMSSDGAIWGALNGLRMLTVDAAYGSIANESRSSLGTGFSIPREVS